MFLFANAHFVLQLYRLDPELAIKDAAGNTSRERTIVDNIVISSVAMKSVMA
jgi:EKC/KEOPS complex subunit CGI121/TPRKB